MRLSYTATLDREEALRRLDRLLIPGSVLDAGLARRIDRLALAFRSYAENYPLPFWAPGLSVSNEMRGLTEALLPISQVRGVFELLLRRGCRFPPFLSGSYLRSCASWLDLLQKHRPQLTHADPATTLRELARDGAARNAFLFALLLPHHFGGGFDRYPEQSSWLEGWLKERAGRFKGGMRVLDSACGSGEGTYQLAELLEAAGLKGKGGVVHGSTLEPIELFAGAHLFFPHDQERERAYRGRVAPLFVRPDAARPEFYLDRVGSAASREPYHLVICNGLLGGPLMHDPDRLAAAFKGLASRLVPGGLLLAADRFHAGWRLRVPVETLYTLMRANGLTPAEVPEGIGGVKTG